MKKHSKYKQWHERMCYSRRCKREFARSYGKIFAAYIAQVAQDAFDQGYNLATKHLSTCKIREGGQ